jgi:hypothetical protein
LIGQPLLQLHAPTGQVTAPVQALGRHWTEQPQEAAQETALQALVPHQTLHRPVPQVMAPPQALVLQVMSH